MALFFRIGATMVLVILLLTTAIYWREARNEVLFLCGNFGPGVTVESVERQLQTATFLNYELNTVENARQLIAISQFPLVSDRCVVQLQKGLVTKAFVE